MPISRRCAARACRTSSPASRSSTCRCCWRSLNRELGIKRLLLEGGGKANGSFLRAGLVDELSLAIVPAVDGAKGAPHVFDSETEMTRPDGAGHGHDARRTARCWTTARSGCATRSRTAEEETMAITVKQRHPALGAEVQGIDMRRPLDPESVRAVRDAWTVISCWCFPTRTSPMPSMSPSRGISASPRSFTRPRSTCVRTG